MRFPTCSIASAALAATLLAGCDQTPAATAKKPTKKPPQAPAAARPAAESPLVKQSDFASVEDALGRVPELVKSSDPQVGRQLMQVEGWLELQGPEIAPQLAALIDDPAADLAIRLTACRVLSKLGGIGTPTLLAATGGEPRQLRLKATECLGRVKPADAKSVQKLIELIETSDFDQRKIALVALAQIGPAAKVAVPKLLAVLNNPKEDETLRSAAKKALKAVDPRKGLMNAY